MQSELYAGHPYGHPDQGTVGDLKAITLDDVKAFHKSHYTRQALILGIAGGADSETGSRVAHSLASLPQGELRLPSLEPPTPPRGLEVTIVAKPAEATAISIGFPIDVTRSDDGFYALAVANSSAGLKVAIVAQNADEIREILTSGKPSPVSYDTQGTPDDVLAEDRQIAVFPLRNVTVKIIPVERMFER